jgi:hypothetical protein
VLAVMATAQKTNGVIGLGVEYRNGANKTVLSFRMRARFCVSIR